MPTVGWPKYSLKRTLSVGRRQWIGTSCTSVPSIPAAAKPRVLDNSCVVERQDFLWRQYFLDPASWWDCRREKKSPRSPDFRHKASKEPLWLNNTSKPVWVDAQLAVLDTQTASHALLLRDCSAPTVPDEKIFELCENGNLRRAVDALTVLAEADCPVSISLLHRLIQRCRVEKNLILGRRMDDLTTKLGHESNSFLGNHILRMYACQGQLQEAMKVFTRVTKPDAPMWFSIISAQAKHGKPSQVILLYQEMRNSGMEPNGHIFVAVIQACARTKDLELGRKVHAELLESGIPPDSFVCSSLVDMYAKCGDLEAARGVFANMATRDAVTWNAMINGYAEHGLGLEALTLYARMEREGLILADRVTFSCLLKACASVGALQQGRQLHSQIMDRGLLEGDKIVGTSLITMYAKCGELEAARRVFDSMARRDALTWTAMIKGYAEHGPSSEALTLYAMMEQESLIIADSFTFSCLLKVCASAGALNEGRQLHSKIVDRGLLEGDILVGTCLVDMYAKCGKLEDARMVFDRLASRDAVTWNAMLSGYVEHGFSQEALALYAEMEQEGRISADAVTFACLLKACGSSGALQLGRQLHSQILDRGLLNDQVLGTCLVNMYAKCGKLDDARTVFENLTTRDLVAWTAMISGYAEHGLGLEALALYERMEHEGSLFADGVTFACLLKACASVGDIHRGRQLHSQIVDRGILKGDKRVGTCLINMYAKCGNLEDARMVFDSLPTRDTVTWNAMLSAYVEHGFGQQALSLYATMQQEGLLVADSVTFSCLLKASASCGSVQEGRQLHSQIVAKGLLEGDKLLGTCLIDMYAKCGKLSDARVVFDSLAAKDVVAWTAMINAYAEHGLGQQALTLYARMEQEGVVLGDSVTYACLLNACAIAGNSEKGRQLHSQIAEKGILEGDVSLGNCLVNMYAKCGELKDARLVFDSMGARDVVTWNMLISGYIENELGLQALSLYAAMEAESLIPADSVTFSCLLKACAGAGALQKGRQLHSHIVDRGLLEGDQSLGTSLVNMYAKCGKLDDARMVFDSLSTRDVVAWTAMISGYGTNNEGRKATACFEEMLRAGIQPDDTTFTCLLVACSHEGLVSVGRQIFDAMVKQHGLNPTLEHYNCMVDLLGRAGHIDDAEEMLLSADCKHDAVGLTSLLNACKSHGDIERGTRFFNALLELDRQNASSYVLMANIYADANRWEDVVRIERLRKLAGARKKPAMAGIEVNKQVQTFLVGEERDDISCKVQRIYTRLKEEGNHVPHTEVVLKPLSEKEKESDLCGHAEKLALAYGLLNTPDGTPLLVTKNLRMCRDCHSSTEIMSKVEKRDIVVRDAYRVHRFEGGKCSCKGRC